MSSSVEVVSSGVMAVQELVYTVNDNLDRVKTDRDLVTNSFVIAEYAGIEHRSVFRMISKNIAELEEFGKLRFDIAKIKSGRGRKRKYAELNRGQALLLFTYLQNTPKVKQFKNLLVKAFLQLESELIRRGVYREIERDTQKELTKAIDESGENERMHGRGYVNFTNLIYGLLFNVSKKKLCESRGVEYSKSVPVKSFLSSEEIQKVEDVERIAISLLKLGKQYPEIKEELTQLYGDKEGE